MNACLRLLIDLPFRYHLQVRYGVSIPACFLRLRKEETHRLKVLEFS